MDSGLLIPIVILIVLELILTGAALYSVFTHKTYKFGKRWMWVLISLIEIVGPIIYFVFGRSDE
jgi:hypothetical protein